MFNGSYLFQTIILGIQPLVFGGVKLSQLLVGDLEVQGFFVLLADFFFSRISSEQNPILNLVIKFPYIASQMIEVYVDVERFGSDFRCEFFKMAFIITYHPIEAQSTHSPLMEICHKLTTASIPTH